VRELPFAVPELLIQKAQYLDTLYVATRYVNGHVSGAPFEHYGALQSQQAIDYAGEIITFARSQMA
jgi:HEPN domain-containing protein